jgi:hypothetical protein
VDNLASCSNMLSRLPFLQEPHRQQTCHDLGGMFLLDMLLGNADRLPCTDLSWRGNPGNLLFGSGEGKYGGRLVAIDSAVQRRPPALRSSADDERTERLAQLLLHSRSTASEVLRQVGARAGASERCEAAGNMQQCSQTHAAAEPACAELPHHKSVALLCMPRTFSQADVHVCTASV